MTRRLDLGSGYYPYADSDPEWEHLDINPLAPHVEHVYDITAGSLPFPDGTFGEMRAFDVLEHVPYTRTALVVGEWARLLAPGGRLSVMTPDAERIFMGHVEHAVYEEYGDPPDGPSAQDWKPPHLRDLPVMVSTAWRLLGGFDDGERARDGDDWRWNAHYALFSADSLRWYLERAGFVSIDITTNAHPNLIATAERSP